MNRVECCELGMLVTRLRSNLRPVWLLLRWLDYSVEQTLGTLPSVLICSFELLVSVGSLARPVVDCVPSMVPLVKSAVDLTMLGVLLGNGMILINRFVLVRTSFILLIPRWPCAVSMMWVRLPTG